MFATYSIRFLHGSILFALLCCLSQGSATNGARGQEKDNSPATETVPTGTLEDHEFVAAADGSKEHYVVITPKGFDPAKKVSIVFGLHGHGSDRWQFAKHLLAEGRASREIAAARGMLYVSPDYRAKTSWMGPKAEADMVQIIAALRKEYDVEHVVILGASMGGTSVLTFAALHPDLVDGVVSLNGTADLENYTRFLDAIAASYGGTKAEKPEEYRKRSAVNFPEKFKMPLATTTGGNDKVVPPDSVLKLVEAVKKHNPDVLSLHRPDGGHFTNYEDTKEALEFVLDRITAREKSNEE